MVKKAMRSSPTCTLSYNIEEQCMLCKFMDYRECLEHTLVLPSYTFHFFQATKSFHFPLSKYAKLVHKLTLIEDTASRQELANSIDAKADGGTSIGAGLYLVVKKVSIFCIAVPFCI